MSEIVTDTEMRRQVAEALADHGDEVDVDAIVASLIENFGRVDVDSTPPVAFWAIVRSQRKLPAVRCFEFCVYGDGHAREHLEEDQWCTTPLRKIHASCYPPPKHGDDREVFEVSGQAWHHGRAPVIEVAMSGRPGYRMTADEARRVAHALLSTADELEGRGA